MASGLITESRHGILAELTVEIVSRKERNSILAGLSWNYQGLFNSVLYP